MKKAVALLTSTLNTWQELLRGASGLFDVRNQRERAVTLSRVRRFSPARVSPPRARSIRDRYSTAMCARRPFPAFRPRSLPSPYTISSVIFHDVDNSVVFIPLPPSLSRLVCVRLFTFGRAPSPLRSLPYFSCKINTREINNIIYIIFSDET